MIPSAPHLKNHVQESDHEALLKVTEIAVFYGNLQVLWDVSLIVRPREIVALIGSNGSGKSTLLDTLSGVIHPVEGTIEFSGRGITNSQPFEIVSLGITQVPEGRQLFPDLTVLDNLIMGSYGQHARSKKEQNLDVVYEHFPILKRGNTSWRRHSAGGSSRC
jgi:branched-chain amino acid transport system ATP-binding protein